MIHSRRNLHGQRQLFTTSMDFMSSFPRPVVQYFSRHHTEQPIRIIMYSLSFSLTFPVLVNATKTSVYNTFIAQHIYFHLLQSSRVNRNTRLQVFQDQCFAISLVTRTFCERSVEEFDSVKYSHFHIEMYCNCEVVSTFSSRKKVEGSTC